MPFHPRRRNDEQAGEVLPMRALIVDDSAEYRAFISGMVSSFGFEVTACADGAEALRAVPESGYDLLVADGPMSQVNGQQVISAIRGIEQDSHLYAIKLGPHEDNDARITAHLLGFDAFMSKSASEAEVIATLSAARRLIARQRGVNQRVRELYGLATRDDLTGVSNRRFFFHEAQRLVAEGATVNLVFFDLDEFKSINDTLGHLAGDRILRDIGALFLRQTRSEDLIARYGGDEFVMLVASLEPGEVEGLALRLAREIQSMQWTFGTEMFSVGVTAGIACSSLLDEPSVAQLISAGDRDLYKNKWLRKRPGDDPRLYEYTSQGEARVLELVTEEKEELRIKNDE